METAWWLFWFVMAHGRQDEFHALLLPSAAHKLRQDINGTHIEHI